MARYRISEKWKCFQSKPLEKKLTILLPYIVTSFLAARFAELYRLCEGNLVAFLKNIPYIYRTLPHFSLNDLLIGIMTGILIIWLFMWHNKIHRKNERLGEEYGSARWGTAEDIKPFIDRDAYNNIILSQTERLSMEAKMPKFELNRNKHVVVYGGSGSGKTYRLVKPNLYQLYGSYVLTDPKGYI